MVSVAPVELHDQGTVIVCVFPPIVKVSDMLPVDGDPRTIGRLFLECWRTSVLKKLHTNCSKRLQGQKLSQEKLLQI
jgi:hypothetical protein